MHIPDGFIPMYQAGVYYIIAIAIAIKAFRWVFRELPENRIMFIPMLSAAIFALQAINIPIPWGTSGHILGAAMSSIILGSPFAGIAVITLVLSVQTFIFYDGGYTAFGANLVAMGIVASFTGYYMFLFLRRLTGKLYASIFISSWISIIVAAITVAIILGVAGTFPLKLGIMYMGIYHTVIGIVAEGAISTLIIRFISRVKPDVLSVAVSREVKV